MLKAVRFVLARSRNVLAQEQLEKHAMQTIGIDHNILCFLF